MLLNAPIRTVVFVLALALSACGEEAGTPDPLSAPCSTCAGSRIGSHAIVWPEFTPDVKNHLALAASAMHAGMIRVDLGWVALQPQPPPAGYDWHWADESVRAAKQYGLDILPVITEIPAWASSAPAGDAASRFYAPNDASWDDWQAFISAFVTRYGSRGTNEIHVWEIGAEANLFDQWRGSRGEFARLYSLAYDAIKAADPSATVLMAGMTEHGQPEWFQAVMDDPAYPVKTKIDAIAVHIRGSVAGVQNLVAQWRALFATYGFGTVPMWITEFGFPSSPTYQPDWDPDFVGVNELDGERKQAEYYEAIIPWLMTDGNVHRLFVTLRDLDTPNSGFASEGLINLDGTHRKQAFATVRRFADQYH